MSLANVEIVRRVYEGWARGDFMAPDAFDPEVEFEMVDWPEGSRSRGLDGMRRSWRAALGAWEDFRAVPTEFIDAGGDVVVVLNRIEGRGKESGLDVRADISLLGTAKDGETHGRALLRRVHTS